MRLPTHLERVQMELALMVDSGCSQEEAHDILDGARIAVFDNYISDGPGFTGTVAAVIYSGGPGLNDVYTFNQDGIATLLDKP